MILIHMKLTICATLFLKQVNYPHKQVLESIEINLICEENLPIHGSIEYFNSTRKDLN